MSSSDYEVGHKKPPLHTRFKPGQSGNPGGRPKGSLNLTNRLRKKLQENDGAKADRLLDALIEQAENGENQSAFKLIFDRIDGAVIARVRMEAQLEAVDGILDVAREVLDEESFDALCIAIADRGSAATD